MINSTLMRVGVFTGLVLTALVFSGCTSQYFASTVDESAQKLALSERFTVSRNYEWVIHPHDSVYLSSALDSEGSERPRHIHHFNLAMRDAVAQYFPDSAAGESPLSLREALKKARTSGKSLLFYPRLGAVEDKLNTREELVDGQNANPQGEFGPDKVFFQVLIYEARTGKLLDVSTINARGKLFAGKNTLPIDLFAEGAQAFIINLRLAPSAS